ncbi:hypothetical protein FGO68_gene12577 [Halteria grandinella]|uniref:Uncharacterized protein n=1 Tax=Halteria grandinella TaxID=5974 RepID=A0A8J8P4V7_HALGN|nr:hypothetical protein FGO68_gene12577 [Halteria grandinella]
MTPPITPTCLMKSLFLCPCSSSIDLTLVLNHGLSLLISTIDIAITSRIPPSLLQFAMINSPLIIKSSPSAITMD